MITNKYNIGDRVKFTMSWTDPDGTKPTYEGTINLIEIRRSYTHILYRMTNCYRPGHIESFTCRQIQEINIIGLANN